MQIRLGLGFGARVLAAAAVVLVAGCGLGEGDEGMAESGSAEGGPSSAYCDPVASWSTQEAAFEDEVVTRVNAARAMSRTCGNQSFDSSAALTMEPRLRCAARVHSLDMATRGFFDHDNPEGESPFDRMELAGYSFLAAGENIAAGQTDPQAVVEGWLESPGHCANIMSPDFSEIGVGYHAAAAQAEFPHYWTQTFGTRL